MPTVRIRLTGSRDAADTLLAQLHGVDGVERVEEVDDEMPDMRDDSSSADMPDDTGAEVYRIEVHTPRAALTERVRDLVEVASRDLDATIEFVDRF